MKRILFRGIIFNVISFCSMCLLVCCSVPGHRIFEKRTPHEMYEHKINDAGLQNTALGTAWLQAAQKVLQQPVPVELPYKETGYFAAEKPAASGYIFHVRRGEKLNVTITAANAPASFLLFADLWQPAGNSVPRLLIAADTTNHSITYEVKKDDSCILRIQPELLRNGGYTVTITTAPTLAFPVPSEDHPKIGSFWGASRDNGTRKHEGIDIFGKFRTPVVAAADGYITSERGNTLGGKVIFLRPDDRDYTLYYAHLDSQIATEGQSVKAGDVIGLMGNTGNAKYTPTHLHFGIYTNGGAIDPLPFVQKTNVQPGEITASLQVLNGYVHNTKTAEVFTSPAGSKSGIEKLNTGTPMQIVAATGSMYKIRLPDEEEAFISSAVVTNANEPMKVIAIDSSAVLLSTATETAAGKALITKGTKLKVYGTYKDFYFIESALIRGWIRK